MSHLTPLQKLFVVKSLAHFSTLAEVCEQLKEEFGVTASTAQVARYKPGTVAGAGLSMPLRDAFDIARREFQSDNCEIPILHKNYRLKELNWHYQKIKHKDSMAAARLLEQAAKESGGHYHRPHESDNIEPKDDGTKVFGNQIAKAYAQKAPEPA